LHSPCTPQGEIDPSFTEPEKILDCREMEVLRMVDMDVVAAAEEDQKHQARAAAAVGLKAENRGDDDSDSDDPDAPVRIAVPVAEKLEPEPESEPESESGEMDVEAVAPAQGQAVVVMAMGEDGQEVAEAGAVVGAPPTLLLGEDGEPLPVPKPPSKMAVWQHQVQLCGPHYMTQPRNPQRH